MTPDTAAPTDLPLARLPDDVWHTIVRHLDLQDKDVSLVSRHLLAAWRAGVLRLHARLPNGQAWRFLLHNDFASYPDLQVVHAFDHEAFRGHERNALARAPAGPGLSLELAFSSKADPAMALAPLREHPQAAPLITHLSALGWNREGRVLMELVGLLPRLQQLDLICYTDLTDELLLGLTALPALRHLRLTMCETLSETALRALMGPQSAIESLLLDGMCLSAEHLAALANSPRLRRLGLKGCQPLGREALRHCRPLPALTELVLASNDWVDAEVVDTLAEQYPGLEHLNLSGCLHVNDQALQATQGLPRLRNLWVSGLNLVTPQAVVGLAGASPALTEVMVPRSFRLPADAPTPLLNASGQPVALITKALPG